MSNIDCLVCSICGKKYKASEVEYTCPCEHANVGNLTVELDLPTVRARIEQEEKDKTTWPQEVGMWRYKSLLPIDGLTLKQAQSLPIGNTPLVSAPALAERLGIRECWVKDDGRSLSASLKDRASALVALKANLAKTPIVATASTGNAAAALSAVCAALKQRCIIFVPASAPEAKRTQLLVYGAEVVLVDGVYDDAFDLCAAACAKFGWYCRSTGVNPYTSEGKKTVSYELCEQLYRARRAGDGNALPPAWAMRFEAPDYVAVSVGDGNIISGVYKGLRDLAALGLIDHVPKIIGVQAKNSSVIARAWERDHDFAKVPLPAEETPTVADSISAGVPRDACRAVKAVKESGGFYIQVTDEEILAAVPEGARLTSVFSEPAGAATIAGLLKASKEGKLGKDASVVVINTGNGLKDIVSAKKSVEGCSVTKVAKGDLASLEEKFGKK